jgi:hypothetical protein
MRVIILILEFPAIVPRRAVKTAPPRFHFVHAVIATKAGTQRAHEGVTAGLCNVRIQNSPDRRSFLRDNETVRQVRSPPSVRW